MKKLMIAALAAVAMAGAAQAAQSYGIVATCKVKPYAAKDTSPSDSHGRWYSCYVMKQEDAQAAMGTKETVTYQTMADWLGKNFAANKQSVIDNAAQIPYDSYSSYNEQYSFSDWDAGYGSSLGSALGVFFYGDGENLAYNVVANGANVFFAFDDDSSSTSHTGWTAATTGGVPEPTSGLLLLLGVAGLALKRKQK